MKKLCLFVLSYALLAPISTFAQETKDDLTLVKESVEHYFEGYIHRDLEQLELAFDTEHGTMKLPSKTASGETIFENGYFKEIIPKWGAREKLPEAVLGKAKLTILSIEVMSAQMAVAVIKMEVGEKIYIDVLSLQKMNDRWKITNKMYVEL